MPKEKLNLVKRINNIMKNTIQGILDKVITEALAGDSLNEKEKQVKVEKSLTVDSDEHDDVTPDQDHTVEDVIEKLNTIRSGRSLRDEDVKQQFSKYYEELSDAEKLALYSLLTGIGQILTTGLDSSEAEEPEDHDAIHIHATGDTDEEGKKSIKPHVVKTVTVSDSEDDSLEDDSPPTPIKPVKR